MRWPHPGQPTGLGDHEQRGRHKQSRRPPPSNPRLTHLPEPMRAASSSAANGAQPRFTLARAARGHVHRKAVIFAMGYGSITRQSKPVSSLQGTTAKLLELQTAMRVIERFRTGHAGPYASCWQATSIRR